MGEFVSPWMALVSEGTVLSLTGKHLKAMTIPESPVLRCLAQD